MTTTSTRLIAGVLRQPSSVDRLHWATPEAHFRTAQDYAATEYLYRLRLCSVQLRTSALQNTAAASARASNNAVGLADGAAMALHYPVRVTAQLVYMEEPLSPVIESSAVYASAVHPLTSSSFSPSSPSSDAAATAVDFVFTEEWLIFPLELCDVPLDATCELDLWFNDTHVGAASFHIYSVEGELRVGQQHVRLVANTCGANATCAPTAAPLDDTAALLDELHRGRFPVVPWLDALAAQQLEARAALHARASLRSEVGSAPHEKGGAAAAVLTFYLPTATTAVFFEPAVAVASREMLPLLTTTATAENTHLCDYTQRLFPDRYTFFKDYNLSEAKAAITSKSQYFVSECSAPPGPRERHQLASLLSRPPIQLDVGGSSGGVAGRLEETRLLWKYRHFICRDGRLLLPFLRSVDWANTHSTERRAACALLHQWARPGFADILACLSLYFHRVAPVRQYAVRLLRQESDARLCLVTFQLLQAVRYDTAESELATLLLDRATECWEMCGTFYTMLTVEVALERRRSGGGVGSGGPGKRTEGVAGALPASRSPAPDAVFEPLLRRLAERLSQRSPHFVARLRQQHAMHKVLLQLSRQVQQSSLDRLGKTALANKLIAKQSCGLHALFDTLRHRAPHTSHSLVGEANSAAIADAAAAATTTATTQNSSFVTDAPSALAERSPTHSASRSVAADAGTDSEEEREEVDTEEGGHHLATTPISSARRSADAGHGGTTRVRARNTSTTVDALDRCGVVTLPIYPAVPIAGIVPNSLYIFKSAKMPMRLTFKALRSQSVAEAAAGDTITAALYPSAATHSGPSSSAATAAAAAATPSATCLLTPLAMQRPLAAHRGNPTNTGRTATTATGLDGSSSAFLEDPVASAEEDTVPLAMMYKYDDDVRQDQLVVQLIRVMDDLLQQDGLQLYITPYRVIATGPSEGLVEMVPQVTTFLSVRREVLKYLRVYNPTAELLRQAMDRYTRSFAGYCVITFVLGIGDRHLENILLTQDGRLLHIDFGYVLGNDPKPFPPPMKINREMVEVLGGPQSTGFMEFKLYCCSAYNILRKHAALLLHMLLLGAHAEGMPQVTGGEGSDPRGNLLKVQERLRLDLTNAQATQYLQNVIADSVGSIFTNLWDVLHAAAQATRS